jgi:hypothetical protein
MIMAFMSNMGGKKNTVFAIVIMIIMGVVFLTAGIYTLSSRINLSKNGISAVGRVVKVNRHHSSKNTTYRPVVEFTTSSGEKIQVEYPNGTNPPKYSVGDRVTVRYLENNPKNFLIDSTFEVYIFPIIFISIGALIILLCLFLIRKNVHMSKTT